MIHVTVFCSSRVWSANTLNHLATTAHHTLKYSIHSVPESRLSNPQVMQSSRDHARLKCDVIWVNKWEDEEQEQLVMLVDALFCTEKQKQKMWMKSWKRREHNLYMLQHKLEGSRSSSSSQVTVHFHFHSDWLAIDSLRAQRSPELHNVGSYWIINIDRVQ